MYSQPVKKNVLSQEERDILKQIEKQNGRDLALKLRTFNIGPELIDVLEYAEKVQADDYFIGFLRDLCSPDEQQIEEDKFIQQALEEHDFPREQKETLRHAWNNQDYQTFILEILKARGYKAYFVNPINHDYADQELLQRQNAIQPLYRENETLCTFSSQKAHAYRFNRCFILHCIHQDLIEDVEAFDKALNNRDYLALQQELLKGKDNIQHAEDKNPPEEPFRQDDYGTSVISIQIAKDGFFISIKNRYNNRVAGCDDTFDSDPDKIVKGLKVALKRLFKIDFERENPRGFTLTLDKRLVKYHTQKEGIYFSRKGYVYEGVLTPLDEGQIGIEDFIIDTNHHRIFSPRNSSLACILDQELIVKNQDGTVQKDKNGRVKRRAVQLEKNTKTGEIVLRVQETGRKWRKILIAKEGKITHLNLVQTRCLPEGTIQKLPKLEEFCAPALEEVKPWNFYICPKLAVCDVPELKEVRENCFQNAFEYQVFNAPLVFPVNLYTLLRENGQKPALLDFSLASLLSKELDEKSFGLVKSEEGNISLKAEGHLLMKIEKGHITHLALPSITHIKQGVLKHQRDLKSFSAQSLKVLEKDNLHHCSDLEVVFLPALESLGDNCFQETPYLEIYAPMLCPSKPKKLVEQVGDVKEAKIKN